ncbi:MAG TPA: MerR family transcriptional regulator [Pseudonocardia sp.]|uniref:MerR family transcriptional regulator n=1 Tax=Pseudonocardia sp. TaxID=60912 RepID=UPI002CF51FB5|nr:MerR family transcriptional regulator [Pseudonocardia sp.]HTF55227.1 MerR family transcriptional regulator [Pseudonocardia sp.]
MRLLTIGAFARQCRLSPKALRLYDELGLLRPVQTDPHTGYRWYAPEQLERARLVAWLRRIGMPLARIAAVCHLPAADVAAAVTEYWHHVDAEHAGRAELVSSLVRHLQRGDTDMTGIHTPLRLRWATYCDQGQAREYNQDSVWASEGLLGVADGFGPSAGAALPSAVALQTLADAGSTGTSAGALLDTLHTAGEQAAAAVNAMTTAGSALEGAGTTLTALVWAGSDLALVHVGDSRAYVLREGELLQLTHDDTQVQRLIEKGQLTVAEAESHPQRSILVKALHADSGALPDVRAHSAQVGDRYLLCTDGLYLPVALDAIERVLTEHAEPDAAVAALAELVHSAGAPDNVVCVVADVLPA